MSAVASLGTSARGDVYSLGDAAPHKSTTGSSDRGPSGDLIEVDFRLSRQVGLTDIGASAATAGVAVVGEDIIDAARAVASIVNAFRDLQIELLHTLQVTASAPLSDLVAVASADLDTVAAALASLVGVGAAAVDDAMFTITDVGRSTLAEALEVPSVVQLPLSVANDEAAIAGRVFDRSEPRAVEAGVHAALSEGRPVAARALAHQGHQEHPTDEVLGRLARVLAPPAVVRTDLPADDAVATEREWLMRHSAEYHGKWIAISAGELVASASSLHELRTSVESLKGLLVLRVP